jgi:hypothetical protein
MFDLSESENDIFVGQSEYVVYEANIYCCPRWRRVINNLSMITGV